MYIFFLPAVKKKVPSKISKIAIASMLNNYWYVVLSLHNNHNHLTNKDAYSSETR